MDEPFVEIEEGEGPLVAAAIHAGHALRAEVARLTALTAVERLREEDPFTDRFARAAPTRIIARRSRFEVDLNRPRDRAVYLLPEDAWGLHVWKTDPPEALLARSLAQYDAFYRQVRQLLARVERRCGRFVVFDLHTYNQRREGPAGPPADPAENPEVNVGTGTLDRGRWGAMVDRFIGDLRSFEFLGRRLDVRENVKFRGGHFSRFIHETFPETGVALAIEFKKFFMDEWSGRTYPAEMEAIERALRATVPGVLEELEKLVPGAVG